MGPHDEALRLLATREGQWAFEREGYGNVRELLARSGALDRFPSLPSFRHLIEAQAWPGWSEVTEWAMSEVMSRGLDTTPPPDGLPPNPVSSWEAYFAATARLPLHPMYRHLAPFLPMAGRALELGSGNGPGSLFLADGGLDVLAIDGQGMALHSLYLRATPSQRSRLTCRVARLQDVQLLPGSVDVLVAGYCLFFLASDQLAKTWPMLRQSLVPGGLMMGQFLGPKDDWCDSYLTHSTEEVDALLAGARILFREEVERDGQTSQGFAKHWHIHHWIVQGPS